MTTGQKICALVAIIVLTPWIIIFGAVGYAALDSMLCWAHFGAGHMGVEGTRWLLEKCG